MRQQLTLKPWLAVLGAALIALCALVGNPGASVAGADTTQSCPWLSPDAGTAAQRAAQVLAQMTPAELATYVAINPSNDKNYQNYIPAIPALCLPSFRLQDGPAGIGAGATHVTALPAPIALAATWDPTMAAAYGNVIGSEAHGKGINVSQGPVINLARVPEGGRNFEGFGEDPVLTEQIADAEIKAIQSNDVVAQAKHFVGNEQETDRETLDELISARTLREIYLPPFESAVEDAHVGSVMCAHPQIDGTYACQSSELLDSILRDHWGFTGFVRSDNLAVHNIAKSLAAGDDLIKPLRASKVISEINGGSLTIATLDADVEPILTTMFEYGFITNPVPETPTADVTSAAHREIAEQVEANGIVLLRNQKIGTGKTAAPVLPISTKRIKSIAVIGTGASSTPMISGGGSSQVNPSDIITPLQAIEANNKHALIHYAAGSPYSYSPVLVPASVLTPPSSGRDGIEQTVTDNGQQVSDKRVKTISANYGTATAPKMPAGATSSGFTETWSGDLVSPLTGSYVLELNSDDGGTIDLNGQQIGSSVTGDVAPVTVPLQAGVPEPLTVTYTDRTPGGHVQLVWAPAQDPGASLQAAATVARGSQVAIVFANDYETEGADRANLKLSQRQNAMINAVAAANPRTVVVLDSGGPVLMPWIHHVAAVVQAWYPGELDGQALEAVLSGRVDPSGRLPMTFPRSGSAGPTSDPEQWPGVDGVANYSEGLDIGYRWYDANDVKPQFPFGFGLSYTTFALSGEKVVPIPGGGVKVAVTVTNTGKRPGDSVAQVYVNFPESAGEPPMQLKAFSKASLGTGQSKRLSWRLPVADFEIWNQNRLAWQLPKGEFSIYVGQSSAELGKPITVPSALISQ